VLDAVVRALFAGVAWDEGGALARRGTAIDAVVDDILRDSYFSAEPPKSTGRELFTPQFVSNFIARCRESKPRCASEDIVATATLLTARSIAMSFQRFVPEPVEKLLVSGGGANNPALMDAIAAELSRAARADGARAPAIAPFASCYFDGDAKEAVAFAFLGWLYLQHRTANVPNATGARGPRILGHCTPA
jgi:anhydro-N-acetylmuramic acid kinase